MLHVAKTSLISSCTGFVREGGALGGWKKKVLPPPPPLHLSLPPSSHGKLFRLPYSLAPFRLYQYTQFKLNGHYLFIYDVTLVAGLYDTKGLLFRIPRLFLIGSNLWYPIYFRPHNGGHSYTCSKLPKAAVGLHQHYPDLVEQISSWFSAV